jgi:ribosomal protein S18 acetylase RimI-like enzyme
LYAVCAVHHGEVVGTGRIVGDGGIYFYLQDVIVHPDVQGMGIGTRIVEMLMEYISENAGRNSMVGLMCAKGVDPLYQKFGFITRPNEKYGPGMCMTLQA